MLLAIFPVSAMAATPMYYVPTQHPGQLGQPVVTTAPGGAAYYAPSQGVVMVRRG